MEPNRGDVCWCPQSGQGRPPGVITACGASTISRALLSPNIHGVKYPHAHTARDQITPSLFRRSTFATR